MGSGPLAPAFDAAGVVTHVGAARSGIAGALEVRRLAKLAARFDVVHTHLFAGDTWGRPAAWLAKTPVVTTEHNVNRDERHHHRVVKRTLARWTDRLVFVSEAARVYAERVEGICHPAACVIPNGVDLARFTRAAPGPGTRVLAVGRDVPQKGFDVLLDALPAGLQLRIAGQGPRRGVQQVAGSTVEWLGPRDDIPALLAGADALVVPSRWEGFGLAALEGMAAGVTVIASRVDGLAELVGDAGVLVPPGDAPALRAALQQVSADPALRARCASAGPARATEFSLERCAARYDALYVDLVTRP
jgi:glycosyltransferase involved in cell wall biosynthesis